MRTLRALCMTGVLELDLELEQAHVHVLFFMGGRPEIPFPVWLNFLRSLRVVSLSSNLVGHDAVGREGVQSS